MVRAKCLRLLYVFFALLWLAACNMGTTKGDVHTMMAKENTELLKTLLEYPEFESYLHPEAAGRTPVIIKVDDLESVSGKLEKFGQPVMMTTDKPSVEAYLEVDQLEHLDETIQFTVRYDIEGVVVVGSYHKGEEGSFKDIEVIEN